MHWVDKQLQQKWVRTAVIPDGEQREPIQQPDRLPLPLQLAAQRRRALNASADRAPGFERVPARVMRARQ
jgi:hypothetical protein